MLPTPPTLACHPHKHAIQATHASTSPTQARDPGHPHKHATHATHASTLSTQSMPPTSPTLARHPRKHTTDAIHASTNSTPFLKHSCDRAYQWFFIAFRYSLTTCKLFEVCLKTMQKFIWTENQFYHVVHNSNTIFFTILVFTFWSSQANDCFEQNESVFIHFCTDVAQRYVI